MVAMRALEIGEGAAKLVDSTANEKPATTAMREIIAGKVMLKEVADQMKKDAKEAKAASRASKGE